MAREARTSCLHTVLPLPTPISPGLLHCFASKRRWAGSSRVCSSAHSPRDAAPGRPCCLSRPLVLAVDAHAEKERSEGDQPDDRCCSLVDPDREHEGPEVEREEERPEERLDAWIDGWESKVHRVSLTLA